jgi:hypothetical protein
VIEKREKERRLEIVYTYIAFFVKKRTVILLRVSWLEVNDILRIPLSIHISWYRAVVALDDFMSYLGGYWKLFFISKFRR